VTILRCVEDHLIGPIQSVSRVECEVMPCSVPDDHGCVLLQSLEVAGRFAAGGLNRMVLVDWLDWNPIAIIRMTRAYAT